MTAASPPLHSVALDLEPAQYLAWWRPAQGVLFVPALGEARVGDEAAARIGLAGQTIRATLFGSVSLVRRLGRPSLLPGAELTIDGASLPAARFLASAARGEPVSFQERQRRYLLSRRLHLRTAGRELEAVTLNVSEGGCAVGWTGPPPAAGEVVTVRLAGGLFAPQVRGVVCWTAAGGPPAAPVGLRLLVEGRAGRRWTRLVGEAARSGGRAA